MNIDELITKIKKASFPSEAGSSMLVVSTDDVLDIIEELVNESDIIHNVSDFSEDKMWHINTCLDLNLPYSDEEREYYNLHLEEMKRKMTDYDRTWDNADPIRCR